MAAECLYQLGRYLEASRAYRELAPQSPFRAPALHRAGVCELLSGNPAQAVELFQAILDHHPGYPEADRVWVWLGEALFRLGRIDDASLAFRTVPESSPAHSQALYGRAWIAFESQRWEEAAQLFGRFLAVSPYDPNRAEAMLALARAHFNRRELRPALEALDRLEAQTTSPSYLSGARFFRGWMLTRSGSKDEGHQILQALLTDDPTGPYAPRAQQALAWLDYSAGSFESALARFNALIDLASVTELEREARQKRADSLYNLGRHKQALVAYRSLGDTPEARHGEALCLYRLGRPAELAGVAEEFASRYPGDPRAADLFFSLAQARSDAGDQTGAASAYRKAARMSKDESRAAEARLEAARSLVLAGKPEAALASLEPLATRRDAVGLAALRELARLLEEHGTLVQAREAWDRLAERTKGQERTTALRSAARWARASLDWGGARQRMEAALAACPAEAVVLRQELLADLGELLLLEGRPEEAALPLAEAAEMGASAGGLRAFLSLARAQEAAGQTQEALESVLRIGYLYPVSEAEVAQALLRAAELLETQNKVVQARALYEKVVAEGPVQWAEQARARLANLPASSTP
jgi:tetratricopeptide (TPR) repeat protein